MVFDERIFWAVWLAGLLVTWPTMIGWAVRSRRRRGEPLVPRRPTGALYFERAASGSARGWFGGAGGALVVAVTADELWLAPIFPITLFLPYGAYGLDHRVRKKRVVRVEARRSWQGTNVELELPGRDGRRNAEVKLKVRDLDAFMQAMRQTG